MLSRRKFFRLGGATALACGASGLRASKLRAEEYKPPELDSSYIYYCPELIEIKEPGPLIRDDGTARCSWSRRPYLDLNFEDADFFPIRYFQRYRMKKWDMYHMITPDHYLSFLVAWIGYGAFASAYVYDRKANSGMDDMHIRLPRPEFEMMRDSTAGRTEYDSSKVYMLFEVDGERTKIKVHFPGFAGVGMLADIDLHLPEDHESICATHLTHPRRMHYGRKINCMTAKGKISLGRKTFILNPENSFGMLDFGRGYYPAKLFWYWAVSSGRHDGKPLGFNLGHGNSPEGTAENAIFYDGKIHKIGVTRCQCDPDDLYKPWQVWTPDGRLDLTMIPRNVRYNELKIGSLYSIGRPALGLYSGKITLDSGKVIKIKDLFGLFEWVDQKW
jgi:hypothetical protein